MYGVAEETTAFVKGPPDPWEVTRLIQITPHNIKRKGDRIVPDKVIPRQSGTRTKWYPDKVAPGQSGTQKNWYLDKVVVGAIILTIPLGMS